MPFSFPNQPALLLTIGVFWAVFIWAASVPIRAVRAEITMSSFDRAALLLSLCAAIALCFTSIRTASELSISDATEYAVTGERLYRFGTFDLVIEGKPLPPRYPIFFPLLVVVPGQLLFGPALGSSIHLIGLIGVLGFLAAWLAAFRIGGARSAIAASIVLLVIPDFRKLFQVIMSDGPLVSITLLLLLLFTVAFNRPRSPREYLAAGTLGAFAAMLRTSNILLLIPFLPLLAAGREDRKLLKLSMLATPVAAAFGMFALYNFYVFNSPFRTGYHFWVSVPTDFPDLLFSLRYVPKTLSVIASKGNLLALLLVIAAAPVMLRLYRERIDSKVREVNIEHLKASLYFVGAIASGICAIYLPFYWTDFRFFAPLNASLCVPVGALIAIIWQALYRPIVPGLLALIPVILYGVIFQLRDPKLPRVNGAAELASLTPANARIITAMDPVYLEPSVVRGSQRAVIPISREVQFANKICRWTAPAGMEPPISPLDTRNAGLVSEGAVDPVSHTALEELPYVDALVSEPEKVFLSLAELTPRELKVFRDRYKLEPVSETLFQVMKK